jgi:putative ABC transport system permease protein
MYQCLLDERLTEFAVFRTLGATKRGITKLMIKEASVLSAISISIGVFSGILFGLGFLVTSRGVTVPPHSAFLLELVLPYNQIFASIILVLGIVLFVNFIYVRRISKLQINTILRGE